MKTPEERAAVMRQQVFAKVHWGARDWEVLNWLEEKHGISGAEAEALLAEAQLARKKAVRNRALLMLFVSGAGILGVIVFFALQYWSGVYWIGYGPILITGVGLTCVGLFLQNIKKVMTGESDGPVDG